MAKGNKRTKRTAEAPLATWRVHLAANQGVRGAVAAAACALVAAGALVIGGGTFVSFAMVAAFLWSLSDFFLPTDYTLTGREVVARTPFAERRMPWRQVHGFAESEDGILLTPLARRSMLDRFRGMFLHVTPEHRERVLELVRDLKGKRI